MVGVVFGSGAPGRARVTAAVPAKFVFLATHRRDRCRVAEDGP
ncbi:hypothetical protein C731_3911 [Mycolicibacterium hassiacum DSM 44199]|uniref:Uncharacterized protein n=1 Tax=Mycolicibacterium hassiacum (strain DSM 44199 / CIP 105218 / JCM 12690 / 3849) TaxID=1122247 RepID=K5BIV8_MYCHD|nr:hypothetical protein C731_3911 [Mycolicibacterium hassiacum DSM 44199]